MEVRKKSEKVKILNEKKLEGEYRMKLELHSVLGIPANADETEQWNVKSFVVRWKMYPAALHL